MSAKNHYQGKKMGGRHTTVIDAARKVVDFLETLPEVSKIATGFITSGVGGGQQRIKISDMTGGILIKVRGNISIQEIRVYSSNIESTKAALEENFG